MILGLHLISLTSRWISISQYRPLVLSCFHLNFSNPSPLSLTSSPFYTLLLVGLSSWWNLSHVCGTHQIKDPSSLVNLWHCSPLSNSRSTAGSINFTMLDYFVTCARCQFGSSNVYWRLIGGQAQSVGPSTTHSFLGQGHASNVDRPTSLGHL